MTPDEPNHGKEAADVTPSNAIRIALDPAAPAYLREVVKMIQAGARFQFRRALRRAGQHIQAKAARQFARGYPGVLIFDDAPLELGAAPEARS